MNATSSPASDDPLRTRAVRIPDSLQESLERIAARDHVTISSTIRRLLSAALRAEAQDEGGRV